MRKSLHYLFWPCLAVVFGVLGWLTWTLIELEEKSEQEFKQSYIEEQTRLASWRMDITLNTILITENKRAPRFYLTPSQESPPNYIVTYFQVEPDGKMSTPRPTGPKGAEKLDRMQSQIPPLALKNQVKPRAVGFGIRSGSGAISKKALDELMDRKGQAPSSETPRDADASIVQQVEEIKEKTTKNREEQVAKDFIARNDLNIANQEVANANSLPEAPIPPEAAMLLAQEAKMENNTTPKRMKSAGSVIPGAERKREIEKSFAQQAISPEEAIDMIALDADTSGMDIQPIMRAATQEEYDYFAGKTGAIHGKPDMWMSLGEMPVSISAFRPNWIDGELIFSRTIDTDERTYIQGIWFDWKKLATALLDSARDILPNAQLLPFTEETVDSNHVSRLLAGAPFIIVPGEVPPLPGQKGTGTLAVSLTMAWIFALTSVIGVSILIIGMLRLNERRATFVSAVTHELRTPLTTFNLYTEMLMHGMVPSDKLNGYFGTLQQEASRLTHLVDNVLGFSRIEKSKNGQDLVPVDGLRLLQCINEAALPILERAQMNVSVDATEEALRARLVTNPGSIEQIMVNMADNAVKYASEYCADVDIRFELKGRKLLISFRDYGHGISPSMKKRLFKPFSRSAEDAAGGKPGIGLGLALCRELARKLGGDMVLDSSCSCGTCFILSLPLVR